MEVEGAAMDLHSGVFGGAIHQPMSDLIYLLNTLVDSKDNILIEGIHYAVDPVTEEELSLYKDIAFDPNEFRKDIGVSKLLYDQDKVKTLMGRWR